MNIIKKVMVFVMGVVVIGIASTAIGVVTQTKNVEKSVTFEILADESYTPNVYDKVVLYSVLNDYNDVTNVQLIKLNGVDVTYNSSIQLTDNEFTIYISTLDGIDNFAKNGYFVEEDGVLQIGDVISITFDVEVKTPVFVKTLVLLIPLVLSASLIGYLAVKVGGKE